MPHTSDPPELLTVHEAARLLRVSRRTLTRWIGDRIVPSVKVGGRRLLRRGDLDAVLASGGHAVAAGATNNVAPQGADKP